MQDWNLADQIARVENAGLEIGGPNGRAGKCRTQSLNAVSGNNNKNSKSTLITNSVQTKLE